MQFRIIKNSSLRNFTPEDVPWAIFITYKISTLCIIHLYARETGKKLPSTRENFVIHFNYNLMRVCFAWISQPKSIEKPSKDKYLMFLVNYFASFFPHRVDSSQERYNKSRMLIILANISCLCSGRNLM